MALVTRLETRLAAGRTKEDGFRLDLIQAMLRLLPKGREVALVRARAIKSQSESVLAVRYALGDDVKIGPVRSLWVAAAHCRDSERGDVAVAGADRFRLAFAPAIGNGYVGLTLLVEPAAAKPSADMPTLLIAERHDYLEAGYVDWASTVWPQSRRSWFASASLVMLRNLDWSSAAWANRRLLEPLFDPWTAIGSEAAILLAVALQAKEPGERGLAVEATTLLLLDGRLTPASLSAAFVALEELMASQPPSKYPTHALQPRRLSGSMERVAAASSGHALAAQEILASTLACFAGRGPAPVPIGQIAPLLRVMIELEAQVGRPTPVIARSSLERLAAGKGETASLAARLVGG